MHQSLTILGSGYSAKVIFPLAEQRYTRVFATSRNPERHLNHLRPDQRISFDLTQPDTWPSIPVTTDVLWCFPAAPIELVRRFAEAASLRTRRLVVLGSTSAYADGTATGYPPSWLDESAPIDPTPQRVQGEELLRTAFGAIVLRVAGIYGPSRNPIDWIRTGRVNRSRKYVNLIHVEDLAATCLAALTHAEPSGVYNVSDGNPMTWNDICEAVARRWEIRSSASQEPGPPGKRVLNKRMGELLKLDRVGLRHNNLFEALELIQGSSLNEATPSP